MSECRIAMRTVAFVIFDALQALDLVGPYEVFAKANQHAPTSGPAPFRYELVVLSADGDHAQSNSGLCFANLLPLDRAPSDIDTLVIAGGSIATLERRQEGDRLTNWLRDRSSQARRIVSVCTGAFVLGAAGLLDGKRATTHWAGCNDLKMRYPLATVVPDAIYVADDKVFTSAGVTAGIDLALALVEQDMGSAVALAVARDLVLYLRRPGGQSQFSANLSAQAHAGERFRDLLNWIAEHPTADLSNDSLSDRAGCSTRNFGRLFKAQTGMTPAVYVELVRLDRAKMLLETTTWPLARLAERAGLATVATLVRVFRRRLGITPEHYRARFRLAPNLAEDASVSASA
jgi:transcriptional regulator GlxA family with amidase domain